MAKGKVWGEGLRKPSTSLQESSPRGVPQEVFPSSSIECWPREWNIVSQEAHGRLSTQGFYWGLVVQAPSLCQDPRLPEGKRVFSGLSDVNLSESINRQTCRNKEALARGSLRTGYFFTASNYCFGVNLTLCFKTSRLCIVLLFYYYYYSS